MQILERVKSNVNLCGVEIAFNANLEPSVIEGWQPFCNNSISEGQFEKTYASLLSIDYDLESVKSLSGTSYKQKVTFRFPNSDVNRATRIETLKKIKYVKLKQDNGLDLVIGRNDFFQNKAPDIKISENIQLCQIEISAISITPPGYTPRENAYGLPVLIPLTLL